MEIKIKATDVFRQNRKEYDKKTRIVVNQGGRGSSKTWSIAQLFLLILFEEENVLLTVCRKTLPALRATAMRDFFEIMKDKGIYQEENHNKSDLIYRYGNNEIEFISVDQPQKVRGRKRQYLWMNEANEFAFEDFRQLNIRTERQLYMDFNPSDEFHWIYDEILPRDDSVLLRSTYLDNPFLDKQIVKEIEYLKNTDQNYWRIYGLGKRGVSETTIYTHWEFADKMPDSPDDITYGLDFGYNNPTALIEYADRDQNIYWREMLYESHLTNTALIKRMKKLGIDKNKVIYADPSEPDRIEEIGLAGYNIQPAETSVKNGIDMIKGRKLYITKDSVNLLKEIKSYCWKEKDGKSLDEPVKDNDHLMDAGRYAVISSKGEPTIKFI